MEQNLHANATTTPKTRSYIQRSRKSVAELASELGVSQTTIRRWRSRSTVSDHSHRPRRLQTSLSMVEETLVCELRTRLQLPLDDIVEVMRRCANDRLSRSAIHRCLKRHGLNQRHQPDKPATGVFEQATVGFPMPRRGATCGLDGPIADRTPSWNAACGATAASSETPTPGFATRQQAMPVILLRRAMIDKAID